MTPNTRKPEESYEDFKLRLKEQKIADKAAVFLSKAKSLWPAYKGTYIRKVNGPLVHS